MIESVYRKIHPATGIIDILVNTRDKWVSYQWNVMEEKGKIQITFFYDTETQPGCFDECKQEEYIDMNPDFDSSQYLVTSMQNKDLITFILMPRTLLLDRQQWKDYE